MATKRIFLFKHSQHSMGTAVSNYLKVVRNRERRIFI